ncbi:MAG: ATP-binding cassette domain-containing protein [Candidatus Geothermarchaeales archaeon]
MKLNIIEVDGLTKKFGDLVAVDHVSFQVKRKEIFGFLGPNGAGKTTTIRMLCTLTRPTEGSAAVAGHDIVREADEVREHVGLVSEKMIMYDRLTAYENLKLFGKLYDIPSKLLEERIDELLGLVHMSRWRNHQIGTFSSGMRQRINLIRGLINMPEVLFLDEPTLGLDPQSALEVREFIGRINDEQETSIILTTHMMLEADMLCDRVGIIDYGRIVALDTPTELKNQVSGSRATVLEFDIPNLSQEMILKIEALDCTEKLSQETPTQLKVHAKGQDAFDNIVGAVRSDGGRIAAVRNLDPTLEDVFLSLTGHEVRDAVTEKVTTTEHRHRMGSQRRRARVR